MALLGSAAPVAADGFAFWDLNSPVPDANTATGTTAAAFDSGTAALVGGTSAVYGGHPASDSARNFFRLRCP